MSREIPFLSIGLAPPLWLISQLKIKPKIINITHNVVLHQEIIKLYRIFQFQGNKNQGASHLGHFHRRQSFKFSWQMIEIYFNRKQGLKSWFPVKNQHKLCYYFETPVKLYFNSIYFMAGNTFKFWDFDLWNWNFQWKIFTLKLNITHTMIFSGSNCAPEVWFSFKSDTAGL